MITANFRVSEFLGILWYIAERHKPHYAGPRSVVGSAADLKSVILKSPARDPSLATFDHEIISMVIFSLTLIQEGQLSVSGMCT